MDASQRRSHFYLAESGQDDPALEVGWTELGTIPGAERFLEAYRLTLGAEDRDVAATYMASLMGGICGGFHYALLYDGVELSFGGDGVKLQLMEAGQRPAMLAVVPPEAHIPLTDRSEDALLSAMARFYGGAVRPVLEAAAAAGGERVLNLWRLLASRLAYVEDHFVSSGSEEDGERVRAHFAMLKKRLSPGVFGLKRNPLDFEHRYVEDLRTPEKQVRQRAACCLAFKAGGGYGYCYTCPRISGDERRQRREKAAAQELVQA